MHFIVVASFPGCVHGLGTRLVIVEDHYYGIVVSLCATCIRIATCSFMTSTVYAHCACEMS